MYIRAELKYKQHENTACEFLTWTILQMEMDCDFKKISREARGILSPPTPPTPC